MKKWFFIEIRKGDFTNSYLFWSPEDKIVSKISKSVNMPNNRLDISVIELTSLGTKRKRKDIVKKIKFRED